MYNSEYLCIDKNNKAHEIAKNIVSHLYKYISKIKEKDTSENWNLMKQLCGLLVDQPSIATKDLSKIKSK